MITINPTKKFAKKAGASDLLKAKDRLWNTLRTYIFNKYNFTCYTCDTPGLSGSNLQLGHFHPGSTCSLDTFFHINNVRPQCGNCNLFKSGNPHKYRDRMLKEIGEEALAILDKRVYARPVVKWDVSDYEREIAWLEDMIDELN